MPPSLASARKNYRLSALIARRAVREARAARDRGGSAAVARVVLTHQIAQAQTSEAAIGEMLAEQDINSLAEAMLDVLAFTSTPAGLDQMLDAITDDFQFDRLVESLVQDAGRAAESVAVAVRPDIYHVRYVNPPCCARCAILAGRVYRWSDGFLRHPNCDCSMIPTTVAAPYAQDPDSLVEDGLVTGLSKADMQAFRDGADLGKIVNVRSRKAGLREGGEVLRRNGKATPAAIYREADGDRERAVELLRDNGYLVSGRTRRPRPVEVPAVAPEPVVPEPPARPKFEQVDERNWVMGEHKAIINTDLTPEQRDAFLRDVETVLEGAGDTVTRPVIFFTGDTADFRRNPNVGGYVIGGTDIVHLNPRIAKGTFQRPSAGHTMPAQDDAGLRLYTLAHELGHVIDDHHNHTHHNAKAAGAVFRKYKKLLSRYGATSRHEAYAEAWAQWLLGGPGSSEVADAYAEVYGWSA